MKRCAEPVWEQLSLFAPAQESPMKFPDLRMVGDTVGRLVLAECEEAMVTKVEGLPNFPFTGQAEEAATPTRKDQYQSMSCAVRRQSCCRSIRR